MITEDETSKFKQLIGKTVKEVKMIWENDLDFEALIVFTDGTKLTWGYEVHEGSTEIK